MLQRGGEVAIRLLENVHQRMIEPPIRAAIDPGAQVYTDEYGIYARLPAWGYGHRTVCHSQGEYARDEDGDGFHEGPCQHHRGVLVAAALLTCAPPRHLPGEAAAVPVGFFQFVHNARIRGKGLLEPLLLAAASIEASPDPQKLLEYLWIFVGRLGGANSGIA